MAEIVRGFGRRVNNLRCLGLHVAPFFHELPIGLFAQPMFREPSHDSGALSIVTDGTIVAVFLFFAVFRC